MWKCSCAHFPSIRSWCQSSRHRNAIGSWRRRILLANIALLLTRSGRSPTPKLHTLLTHSPWHMACSNSHSLYLVKLKSVRWPVYDPGTAWAGLWLSVEKNCSPGTSGVLDPFLEDRSPSGYGEHSWRMLCWWPRLWTLWWSGVREEGYSWHNSWCGGSQPSRVPTNPDPSNDSCSEYHSLLCMLWTPWPVACCS